MESYKFSDREFKFVESDNRMLVSGYAAVFNTIDDGGDMIVRGAFSDWLKSASASGSSRLPMYLEHGKYGGGPVLPVGFWSDLEEDEVGLKASGEIVDTPTGREAHQLLNAGLLRGQSIGYRVNPDGAVRGTKPGEPRRTLKSLSLFEISLVQRPMNPAARVVSVKSDVSDMTEREFERTLKEIGFSRSEAATIVSRGFKALTTMRDAGEEGEMAAEIRRLATSMKGV